MVSWGEGADDYPTISLSSYEPLSEYRGFYECFLAVVPIYAARAIDKLIVSAYTL